MGLSCQPDSGRNQIAGTPGRLAWFLLLGCAVGWMGCGVDTRCRPLPRTQWPAVEQRHPVLPVLPERSAFLGGRSFASSFEALSDFEGFFLTPNPYRNTSFHELSSAQRRSGALAHHAWMDGANNPALAQNMNHRGYPAIQLHQRGASFGGVLRLELAVYLDVPLSACADKDWFSFATLTSYSDDQWQQVQLVNVDSQGIVHLMHVPSLGQSVQDIYQTSTVTLPWRQWVVLTMLVDYTTANAYQSPYLAVWQDGVLVSAARFNPRVDPSSVPKSTWPPCLAKWDGARIEDAEALCGLTYAGPGLAQAHFGLYAPPLLTSGEVFNDDLEILEAPPR